MTNSHQCGMLLVLDGLDDGGPRQSRRNLDGLGSRWTLIWHKHNIRNNFNFLLDTILGIEQHYDG
jgi:hypothetical protein